MAANSRQIEAIREYVISLGGGGVPYEKLVDGTANDWGVHFSIPMDWYCSEIDSNLYKRRINAMYFLFDSYNRYLETHEGKYANLILQYIYDFVRQNPEYVQKDTWQWNDDATAERIRNVSIFYYDCRSALPIEMRGTIETSMRYHADLLASGSFYSKKHNHGMHQDIALLIYELLYGEGEKKERYIRMAKDRTREYLDYVYTSSGVYKEHTIAYARLGIFDIAFMIDILEDIDPEFTKVLSSYVQGGMDWMIHMTKPDYRWPAIGDGRDEEAVERLKIISKISPVVSRNPGFLYLKSSGREGAKPPNDAVYKDGGYAAFRSDWSDAVGNATWMAFCAATHSSTHKHSDDLQVLLYHKGDLFVEGGWSGTYNYLEKKCAWTYSGYAHNVLLINGEDYPVKIGPTGFRAILREAKETGITQFSIEENMSSVTGYQHRFNGVEQWRTLQYLRHENKFLVEDVLLAEQEFDGTLLWHIAEGVASSICGERQNHVEFRRAGELVAELSVEASADCSLAIIRDEDHFPYTPWVFGNSTVPALASLLKADFRGTKGKNVVKTQLQLR